MHFIIATDIKKVDAETRKLIRSQVMKGKNKIKYRKPKPGKPATLGILAEASSPLPLDEVIESRYCSISKRIGTSLSGAGLAEELDPVLCSKIVELSSFTMRVIYPLGSYIEFDDHDNTWFDSLSIDPAYLHITAFAAQALKDILVARGAKNSESTLHYLKGVHLLRQRLEQLEQGTQISDSTISIVTTLAITAHAKGESEAAKYHMEGVRRMVDMRGGLEPFRNCSYFCRKLSTEILRCDIGMALHTGYNSIYFSNNIPKTFLLFPELSPFRGHNERISNYDINEALSDIDPKLLKIWGCMREFCSLINDTVKNSSKLSPDTITYTLTSVMYPLLDMSFQSRSANEIIRLGLLCFCNSIFLQWQGLRTHHQRFAQSFRDSLIRQELEGKIPIKIMLWLLIIGAISVFNVAEDDKIILLLHQQIGACQVFSWYDLQEALLPFGWVGGMHDKLAKRIWDEILAPQGSEDIGLSAPRWDEGVCVSRNNR